MKTPIDQKKPVKSLSGLTVYALSLRCIPVATLLLTAAFCYAQAPALSYSGPQTYKQGTAIATLEPASSGVAAPAYSKSPVALALNDSNPLGIAVDANGNIYVSSTQTKEVKKISAGGGSTVDVGSGFQGPYGLAVDVAGNIYVADPGNHSVKKMPPGGGAPISVITGLTLVQEVAVDRAGNLYVNDSDNNTVTKFPAGGGAPVILSSIFDEPIGVAVDGDGNVYVGGNVDNKVWKIPAGGGTPISIGSGFDGPGAVAVDGAGNVFVADNLSQAVKEIPASGGATITISSFSYPQAIALDAAGNLYVTANENILGEIKPVGGYYISAPLPAGLHFDSATGIISGTPTAGLPSTNYTITAYNSFGSTSATVNITVTPAPQNITAGTATGAITACAGMASSSPAIQQFTVTGSGLSATITATAPAYFEVSLSPGSGYGSSVTLSPTAGVIGNTVVYVRSAATAPAGNISGNVVLASTGVASQNVAVSGTVNALLTVNPVANQTILSGSETAAVNFSGTAILYNWTNDQPGIGLPASGSGKIAPFTAVNTGSSPVTAKITVTPEMVPLRAYISNSLSNTVSVIDIATQTVIATIPVQQGPESVTVTSDGQRVYVGNHIAQSISVINTNTNTVISTIYLGILPYQVVVSPDGNRLYVTNDSDDRIWVISTATNAVVARIPVGSIQDGIAISADGSRVYTSTGSVINTTSNTVVSTIPVGNYPICVAVSPDGSRVYVTNSIGGNLSVINTSTNRVIATIPVGAYPVGVSVSPDGTKVYVANRDSNSVSVINTATNTVRTTIPAIRAPIATSVTPNGSLLYVTNLYNIVTAINTSTNAVVATIPVGTYNNEIGNFISGSSSCSGAPVTFTITVNPPAPTLASMQPSAGHLSPGFTSATTNYTDTVNYTNLSVKIKPVSADTVATIKVNGVAVASGLPSQAIPLAEGPNTITTVVTAEDGVTTKTYTLTVFRHFSSDANLTFMQPTAGHMSPFFTPAIISYNDTVNYTNLALKITPIARDSLATIKVNGVAVVSGSMSQAIPLAQGLNTITTVVTAPDGVTTKTFTITVFRAFSTDANLSQMQPSAGMMSPFFTPAITSYTDAVNYTNATIRISPVVQDPLATLTVNGVAVASGSLSQSIPLAVGSNTITTVVTAPDGVSTKTFTLTVTRAAPIPGALNAAYQPVGVAIVSASPALADDGLLVHQGISPNGDGINDFLVIENIANYPDNKLSVMNRNGQLIFEAKGYDNSSKVFDGHSNKNGQMQLPGTYFYALDYTVKGILKHKTGFIVLRY